MTTVYDSTGRGGSPESKRAETEGKAGMNDLGFPEMTGAPGQQNTGTIPPPGDASTGWMFGDPTHEQTSFDESGQDGTEVREIDDTALAEFGVSVQDETPRTEADADSESEESRVNDDLEERMRAAAELEDRQVSPGSSSKVMGVADAFMASQSPIEESPEATYEESLVESVMETVIQEASEPAKPQQQKRRSASAKSAASQNIANVPGQVETAKVAASETQAHEQKKASAMLNIQTVRRNAQSASAQQAPDLFGVQAGNMKAEKKQMEKVAPIRSSQDSGDDDYWLGVIDANPQLNYYQAELVRLIATNTDLERAMRLLSRYAHIREAEGS